MADQQDDIGEQQSDQGTVTAPIPMEDEEVTLLGEEEGAATGGGGGPAQKARGTASPSGSHMIDKRLYQMGRYLTAGNGANEKFLSKMLRTSNDWSGPNDLMSE